MQISVTMPIAKIRQIVREKLSFLTNWKGIVHASDLRLISTIDKYSKEIVLTAL